MVAQTWLLGLERLVQLLKLLSTLKSNLGCGGGSGGAVQRRGREWRGGWPSRTARGPGGGAERPTCSLWLSRAFHVRQLRSAFIFFLAWRMRAALWMALAACDSRSKRWSWSGWTKTPWCGAQVK